MFILDISKECDDLSNQGILLTFFIHNDYHHVFNKLHYSLGSEEGIMVIECLSGQGLVVFHKGDKKDLIAEILKRENIKDNKENIDNSFYKIIPPEAETIICMRVHPDWPFRCSLLVNMIFTYCGVAGIYPRTVNIDHLQAQTSDIH